MDQNKDLQKRAKEWKQGMIFGGILLIILTYIFWFYSETDLNQKILFTSLMIIGILSGIYSFKKQKNEDLHGIKQGKILKTSNQIGGIHSKYYSFKMGLIGIGMVILGIFILFFEEGYWWLGLFLIIVGILTSIAVKFFWKLGNERLKGRAY